jgi:hypothetical protein
MSKFVKVSDNCYVLHEYDSNDSDFASYTPTHIYTFPDGNPEDIRDIKEIHFTKSKVNFYKDYNNNKCCIDIYDEQTNPNKCRIIGVNGRCKMSSYGSSEFEVYDVLNSTSFNDNKSRYIYIDSRNGLYIVFQKDNHPKFSGSGYTSSHKFKFNGEVMEISAFDGSRNGFNQSYNFNCPSNTPLLFEIKPTPIMKQIEDITGVKLETPPPNDLSALLRVSEILNVPSELLIVRYESICMIQPESSLSVQIIRKSSFGFEFNNNKSSYKINENLSYKLPDITYNLWCSYKEQLKVFLPVVKIDNISELIKVSGALLTSVVQQYQFDQSDNAKKERMDIALKPWSETKNIIQDFSLVLKQVEKITGVKLETPPPNNDCAIKRIAEILDIPDKLLTMINGRVYFYYFPFPVYNNDFSIPKKNNKWKSYIDQIQFFIPPITHGVSTDVITSVQALIEKNPYYDFDHSDEAQRYREEIALRPWTKSDNFSIFMEQIEELIGVKLISPPPSKEHALKRVANIFDIPVEMLIMKNGKVYLIDTVSLNIKIDMETKKKKKN